MIFFHGMILFVSDAVRAHRDHPKGLSISVITGGRREAAPQHRDHPKGLSIYVITGGRRSRRRNIVITRRGLQ